MAGEVEAGKAAVEIVLNDEPLKKKLEEAEKSISDLGSGASGNMPAWDKQLTAVGKAVSMLDKDLGGVFTGFAGKLGPLINMVGNLGGALNGAASGAAGAAGGIAGMGKALMALKIPHVLAFLAAFKLGEWLIGADEMAKPLIALSDYADKYRRMQNEIADKTEIQIQRLKQLAAAEHLSTQELQAAVNLQKELNAEKVKVANGRVVAERGAFDELQGKPIAERLKGQEAVVEELRHNYNEWLGVYNKFLSTVPGHPLNSPTNYEAFPKQPNVVVEMVAGADWYGRTSGAVIGLGLEQLGLSPANVKEFRKAEEEMRKIEERLAEEEHKLAEMRSGESLQALKNYMEAEKQAIANRKLVADSLSKLSAEAEDAFASPRQRQLNQLSRRYENEMNKLKLANAQDWELEEATDKFQLLKNAINEAADKANEQAAAERKLSTARLDKDFAKSEEQAGEQHTLDLAKIEGEEEYMDKLKKIGKQYYELREAIRENLKDYDARMSKVDVGSDEYKSLEKRWKDQFEKFSDATKRWNDLVAEANDRMRENVERAAEYSRGDFFGRMDAERGFKREQRGIDELAQNLQSSGDVAGMQELADAARMAANAARQYAEDQLVLALLDEQLTEEEKDLIDALREHARSQDDLAESYEQAVADLQKASKGFGGGAGGYDPSTVVAKALAQAARNDKSLGYQQKTAEGVQQLVALEKNRRDSIVTFQ